MSTGGPEPVARRPRGRSERHRWLKLGALLALGLYAIAFVVQNTKPVRIDFVFFSAQTSLIWLILIGALLGLAAGVLVSQLYRRGGRKQRREP